MTVRLQHHGNAPPPRSNSSNSRCVMNMNGIKPPTRQKSAQESSSSSGSSSRTVTTVEDEGSDHAISEASNNNAQKASRRSLFSRAPSCRGGRSMNAAKTKNKEPDELDLMLRNKFGSKRNLMQPEPEMPPRSMRMSRRGSASAAMLSPSGDAASVRNLLPTRRSGSSDQLVQQEPETPPRMRMSRRGSASAAMSSPSGSALPPRRSGSSDQLPPVSPRRTASGSIRNPPRPCLSPQKSGGRMSVMRLAALQQQQGEEGSRASRRGSFGAGGGGGGGGAEQLAAAPPLMPRPQRRASRRGSSGAGIIDRPLVAAAPEPGPQLRAPPVRRGSLGSEKRLGEVSTSLPGVRSSSRPGLARAGSCRGRFQGADTPPPPSGLSSSLKSFSPDLASISDIKPLSDHEPTNAICTGGDCGEEAEAASVDAESKKPPVVAARVAPPPRRPMYSRTASCRGRFEVPDSPTSPLPTTPEHTASVTDLQSMARLSPPDRTSRKTDLDSSRHSQRRDRRRKLQKAGSCRGRMQLFDDGNIRLVELASSSSFLRLDEMEAMIKEQQQKGSKRNDELSGSSFHRRRRVASADGDLEASSHDSSSLGEPVVVVPESPQRRKFGTKPQMRGDGVFKVNNKKTKTLLAGTD